MKVSEITIKDVADYLRLDEYDENVLQILIDTSIAYVSQYTGIDNKCLDDYEDFYIVIMILCQDMYDNRSRYVENSNLNRTVETILNMHCLNLIVE